MIKLQKKLIEIPVDIMKNIIIEPTIEFNEGIKIVSKDESNVCMCIFNLPKSKFITYELDTPQKFKINLELFDKVLNRIKTENIILEFENNQLLISDEKNKKKYNLSVLYDEPSEIAIPELTLNTGIKMKTKEFQDLILDISIVSDACKIETHQGFFNISGGEQNKYNYELEDISSGTGKTCYSTEYLNKFMTTSKYFEDMTFEFSSDDPCKLSFKNEDLEIQFILAARISDDY